MRHAGLDETQVGIKIAGRNINNLRYADDTTSVAESKELKRHFSKDIHMANKHEKMQNITHYQRNADQNHN